MCPVRSVTYVSGRSVLLRIRLFDSTAKPTSALLPPVLRCYPLVTAQTVVFARGFGGRIFRLRTVLLCIPLFEATAKTTSSAIKAVAASSAMLPLVTAQTVASRRGFGGCILRERTHGWQAQGARRRTQNSAQQILRFVVALRRGPMSPTGLGFA